MTRIFISHSHADREIASLLVDFLLAALEIRPEKIRCTSVPGHQLPFGTSIGEQLKKDLNETTGLIALITKDSLRSTWVLFELGSSWATEKLVVPILGPGLAYKDLPGPLAQYPGVRIDDENPSYRFTDVINQLASTLEIRQETNARRDAKLNAFIKQFRNWKSQLPNLDLSQQKQIEDLTQKLEEQEKALNKKLEESEKAHKQELKRLEVASQKDKEELERNYQNQKQELEQSRQSEVEQLEQQLEQAKSQNQADQKEIISLRAELKGRSQLALEKKKQEPSKAQTFTVDLGDKITLEMIAIPSGKFLMGTEDEEIERLIKEHDWEWFRKEKPQHEVTVQSFYMGIYPVTQAQYQKIMGKNPSEFQGNDRPVEQVSWNEAVDFCKKLSKQTGKEYRLPTEAEWEYACRAGTTTAYYFGENLTENLANYSSNVGETSVVGQYPSNDFGLYDMHGLVWEWCQDDWHDNYENAPNDGRVWVSGKGSGKVIRGGSWDSLPNSCRSAFRFYYKRDDRGGSIGVRVVCVAP